MYKQLWSLLNRSKTLAHCKKQLFLVKMSFTHVLECSQTNKRIFHLTSLLLFWVSTIFLYVLISFSLGLAIFYISLCHTIGFFHNKIKQHVSKHGVYFVSTIFLYISLSHFHQDWRSSLTNFHHIAHNGILKSLVIYQQLWSLLHLCQILCHCVSYSYSKTLTQGKKTRFLVKMSLIHVGSNAPTRT